MVVHPLGPSVFTRSCSVLGIVLLLAGVASAQSSSGINGRVTDSTSGALPGVTVTITSPAMQVPSVTTVTDADGSYRFLDLRPAPMKRATS